MRYLILYVFLLGASVCVSQVHEDLEGCWLPEKRVSSLLHENTNGLSESDDLFFQVVGFDISKQKTIEIIDIYGSTDSDTNSCILVYTYARELQAVEVQKVHHNGRKKYHLKRFHQYFNHEYISEKASERILKSKFYIFASGDNLILERIADNSIESIIFVNNLSDYYFENVLDSWKYLKSLK